MAAADGSFRERLQKSFGGSAHAVHTLARVFAAGGGGGVLIHGPTGEITMCAEPLHMTNTAISRALSHTMYYLWTAPVQQGLHSAWPSQRCCCATLRIIIRLRVASCARAGDGMTALATAAAQCSRRPTAAAAPH
jgi:hypothetical protein